MACQTARLRATSTVRRARRPRTWPCGWWATATSWSSEDLLPDRDKLSPLFRVARLTVPPASIEEHYSDWSRLVRELGREHRTPRLRRRWRCCASLPAALRERDGRVTVALQESGGGSRRCSKCSRGTPRARALGLAIDIGTTTVAVQLVDLETARVLATRTAYNAQIRRGADVISRIDYARTPERLEELRGLVLDTINALIGEMAREMRGDAGDIRAAFIAGNTTMIHLLLGLPPRYIRESPYVPTVNAVPALDGA